jgi:hypothetical protein
MDKNEIANPYKKAIEQIVEILTIPGEEATDGECIDMIWNVIVKDLGFNLTAVKNFKEEILKQKEGR